MMFRTNAENLYELDLALAELESFAKVPGGPRAMYRRHQLCSLADIDHDQLMARAAMFVSDETEPETTIPTLWTKIRGHRYDKRFEHSTHSLYPFTGKLEPRLARTLINIALGCCNEAVVLDPFCGSGTVLLEANLMGFRSIGFDLDPFAIWLAETKTTSMDQIFDHNFDELWPMEQNPPPTSMQRQACRPRTTSVTLREGDALVRLRQLDVKVDAIVTSPPYFDAIDYNSRHSSVRRRLGLTPPKGDSLGIGVESTEYQSQVASIAEAMMRVVRPGGGITIVAAPYHGVDTPAIYRQVLCDLGCRVRYQLTRPYRHPVLDVPIDVITVLATP